MTETQNISDKFLRLKEAELLWKSKDMADGMTLDLDNILAQDTSEIAENTEGIKVLTPSGPKNFSGIKKIITNECFAVMFKSGRSLTGSKYHKLKKEDGSYCYIMELMPEDLIRGKHGLEKIKEIKQINGSVELYDLLDVEDKQEYYTNDVVSHNCAAIDSRIPNRMNEIWGALGPALSTVRGRTIVISTPKGANGWYYDTYTNSKNMGFNIIDAHWTVHPMFSMGKYEWIKDDTMEEGGYVRFLDDTWPETLFDKDQGVYIPIDKEKYPFNRDGKIRSPWYDFESAKLGPRKTACELDCSFIGTGGEVLDISTLREIKLHAQTCRYWSSDSKNGLMKDYREFVKPKETGKYVITADVCTGDGSDFSTVTVLDLDTLEICGSYVGQPLPHAFARVIIEIAFRFNNPWVVVENAGGGGTTLQELKETKYPKIYYSTLNKKDESLGVSKRKIGLWVSEIVRDKGGDKLEEYIRLGRLKLPDMRYVDEFFNWIWDKDGKRRHAPGKHDDLITSLQHAVYYHAYVYKRNVRNRENFSNIFNIQRTGNFNGVIEEESIPMGNYDMKRNNGRDIIDQKGNLYKKDDGNNSRRGMFL